MNAPCAEWYQSMLADREATISRLEAELAELRALQVNGFDPLAAARAYPQLVADRARLIAALLQAAVILDDDGARDGYSGTQSFDDAKDDAESLLRELGEG